MLHKAVFSFSRLQSFSSILSSGATHRVFGSLKVHTVPPSFSVTVKGISTPDIMEYFGETLATKLETGDILLMTGDVGAGKTTMSRGIVRSLVDEYDLRVTSPTYLLSNNYLGENGVQVHHFDLYRLSGRKDLSTLNIPDIFPTTISLIEWPDRLNEFTPQKHIALNIRIENDDSRTVHLLFNGNGWGQRYSDFVGLVDIPQLYNEAEETDNI